MYDRQVEKLKVVDLSFRGARNFLLLACTEKRLQF